MNNRLLPIISGKCRAATLEMSSTLMRSARSSIINGARDFSSALLAADGRAVVIDEGLPVHVGSAHLVPQALMAEFDDIEPGDCFLNNSPFMGNTHHADFTYCAPVFYAGELLFWVLSRAHQTDVGAPLATTYLPFAATVQEEGLHLPCVRVRRADRDVRDVIRIITHRVRVPDAWYGDYLAQIGALRIGQKRLMEICGQYGKDCMQEFIEDWIGYGDRMMAGEIRRLPQGSWHAESRHDPVPFAPEGIPVRVTLTIDPDAGRIRIDLRDNIDGVPGGFNLTEATTLAGAYAGVFYNVSSDVPRNAGSLARIEVLMRKGAVVGIPFPGIGTSVSTTNVLDRLVNTVQSLFAQLGEPYGIAEGSTGQLPSFSVVSGRDPRRNNAYYVNQMPIGFGGGPGLSGHDGWLTYNKPATGGVVRSSSVEMNELVTPIIYTRIEAVPDSGGVGQWEGAPSIATEFGPRFGPMTAFYVGDSCQFPPRGVCGGGNGSASAALRRDAPEAESYVVPTVSQEELVPGQTLISIWAGGGGYGDPLKRNPNAVARGVNKGWLSVDRARDAYGVVLEEASTGASYRVDEDGTIKQRNEAQR